MIIVTSTVTRSNNTTNFYIPSAEFKQYRKTNYLDTGKMASHEWSVIENQRITVIKFTTTELMNEYNNDAIVMEYSNTVNAYNTTNNIQLEKDVKYSNI